MNFEKKTQMPAAPILEVPIIKHFDLFEQSGLDKVVVEEPLEIRLNMTKDGVSLSHSIAVTMRTPGNDEQLAFGFLFTEGILTNFSQVEKVEPVRGRNEFSEGNIVQVTLKAGEFFDLQRLKRNFYTSSSCGVCGKASIEAVRSNSSFQIAGNQFVVQKETLFSLSENVRSAQNIFDDTGGLHAAALFDEQGRIHSMREDVGRHNAVDKLVGAAFQLGEMPVSRFGLFVSGRASFELVQKAWMAGIPMMAAVGAPSSLAVELAEEAGMTLVGFLRQRKFNVYCHPQRIK